MGKLVKILFYLTHQSDLENNGTNVEPNHQCQETENLSNVTVLTVLQSVQKVGDLKVTGRSNVVLTTNGQNNLSQNVSHVIQSLLIVLVKELTCKPSIGKIFQY